MTRHTVVAFAFTSLLLSGCTSLLGGDSSRKPGGPSAVTVPVGNDLTMPPDLELATPGTAPGYKDEVVQQDAPVDQIESPVVPQKKKTAALAKPKAGSTSIYDDGTAAAPPPQDVFEQYGISKTKPDGTPKTQEELSKELKAAVLLKKKQQNPSYGTIGNIGNIFNDQ
jgi:hypothetical protein